LVHSKVLFSLDYHTCQYVFKLRIDNNKISISLFNFYIFVIKNVCISNNVNVKDNSTIVLQKNYREDKIILEKDDYY
jgi:hypothetical protein